MESSSASMKKWVREPSLTHHDEQLNAWTQGENPKLLKSKT